MAEIDLAIRQAMFNAGLLVSVNAPADQVEAILAERYRCRPSSLRNRLESGSLTREQVIAMLAGIRHVDVRLEIGRLGLGCLPPGGIGQAWL